MMGGQEEEAPSVRNYMFNRLIPYLTDGASSLSPSLHVSLRCVYPYGATTTSSTLSTYVTWWWWWWSRARTTLRNNLDFKL